MSLGRAIVAALQKNVPCSHLPSPHSQVGRPLAFSQIIGIAGRAAIDGLQIWWTRHKRANGWKSLTQRELNSAYMGPEFELSSRCGLVG